MKPTEPLYCVYDMTFNLRNFYVTPVCFQHILFEGNPFIPFSFLIHGTRRQFDLEDYIRSLSRRIPYLEKSGIAIVVDRERGESNALQKVLPNVFCWNHLKQGVKQWLLKNGAKWDEISIYLMGLEQILKSDSLEILEHTKKRVLSDWSEPAVIYSNKYMYNY